MDRIGGVEPKAIEMEFLDPIPAIGDEKFPDRSGVFAVEVDRINTIVGTRAVKVIVGINPEIIPIRSEVVLNNVENHGQA